MARRKFARGVTLIELMTVVVVVAILAAIAVPSYRSYLLRSHRTTATAALLRAQASQEKFFLSNNRYSNDLSGLPSAGGLGLPATTDNGEFYDVTLTDAAGGTTFTLHAKPRAGGGQTDDKSCGEFILDQNGTRTAKNAGGSDNTAECWR